MMLTKIWLARVLLCGVGDLCVVFTRLVGFIHGSSRVLSFNTIPLHGVECGDHCVAVGGCCFSVGASSWNYVSLALGLLLETCVL